MFQILQLNIQYQAQADLVQKEGFLVHMHVCSLCTRSTILLQIYQHRLIYGIFFWKIIDKLAINPKGDTLGHHFDWSVRIVTTIQEDPYKWRAL